MADHSAAAAPADASDTWVARHYFLLRRLHSLTGVVPVGVFLIEHLFTNSMILLGAEEFQRDIDFIWGLPGLLMLEIFGIWLPIAFHAGLGIVYTFTGRPNATHYGYVANWRYVWMRITGMIALVYIFFHIATTRWQWTFGGWWNTPFDPADAAATTAIALQYAWPWVMIFYVVGTLATVFHFANGLWTAAITWGLTLSVTGMRRWGYICTVLGVVLALMGLGSIYKFSVMDAEAARVEAAQTSGH